MNNINAISCLKVHFFKEYLRYLCSDEILYVFLFSKTNTLFWFIFTWFFAIFLHLKTKVWGLNWKKLHFSCNTLQKQSNVFQPIPKYLHWFCSVLQKSVWALQNFWNGLIQSNYSIFLCNHTKCLRNDAKILW